MEITPTTLFCFLQSVVARVKSVLPKKLHNFRSWGGGGGGLPPAHTPMLTGPHWWVKSSGKCTKTQNTGTKPPDLLKQLKHRKETTETNETVINTVNKHNDQMEHRRDFLKSQVNTSYIMRLSMVCPRIGGEGNPRELDFVKRMWVGTSTTVPRVGNLTRQPSQKVKRTWEWVMWHLGKYPEVFWASYGSTKGKEYRIAF